MTISGFQSDDDEDRSPVHPAHTTAVAHEIIKDGSKLSPNLWRLIGDKDTLPASNRIVHILTKVVPLYSDQVTGRSCLTIIEFPSKFMIGASFDDLRDMLRLFVDWHSSDDAAMRRRGGHLDLDWAGFGNLTVELLQ